MTLLNFLLHTDRPRFQLEIHEQLGQSSKVQEALSILFETDPLPAEWEIAIDGIIVGSSSTGTTTGPTDYVWSPGLIPEWIWL